MSSQAITSHLTPLQANTAGIKLTQAGRKLSQATNKLKQAGNKLRSLGSAISACEGVSAPCCACMTRTPPNVRRRLTGGAQVGPGEGILRHTQGQNKTSCGKCFPEVSGLTDHQAQMPQHESCRHIHEDYQEFIFGRISTIRISRKRAEVAPKKETRSLMVIESMHIFAEKFTDS